jgi:hypothetical protein
MKNRTKLMIGIFLISGLVLLGYMGITNKTEGFPPEDDPDDPGNGTGPGLGSFEPPKDFDFIINLNLVVNSLT